MVSQGAAGMAPDPKKNQGQEARRLHAESLAVEKYGFHTSSAAMRARVSLVAILVLTAGTGLIVLFLGADPMFSLKVWVVAGGLLCVAMGYVLVNYRRDVNSADDELRRALASADEDRCLAEAHV